MTNTLPPPEQAIAEFIAAANAPPAKGSAIERRHESRDTSSFSLEIQPLNEEGEPEGKRFCTVSKDVSVRGIGFLHTEPLENIWVLIRLVSPGGQELEIKAKTRHCTRLGNLGLLYQIGVEFSPKEAG